MLKVIGNMLYNKAVKLSKGKTSEKWMYNKVFIFILISTFLIIISGCGDSGGGGAGSGGSTTTATGSATLTWEAPTTNTDGSPLTDLAGYTVYYGISSGNYTNSVDIGNVTGAVISNLSPGTWYFAVTAYDTSGNESDYSDEVSTTI